ncbi:MAG TPA: hypothetical protein VLR71_16610 [Casimicrobiaceae bacterium]|nr:hypothetical protein [Casimicrobiaceae bacterium]
MKDAFRSVATSAPRVRGVEDAALGAPMVWTFDGPFATCLADLEDALRRALVQVGTVTSLAVLIQLSLPALKQRVQAGDVVQPTWGQFLQRLSHRYGLPAAPRVRHVRTAGPLATLIVVYRS